MAYSGTSVTTPYTDTYLFRQDGAPYELLRQTVTNGACGVPTCRYWYVTDGRGNVVALTDTGGNVVDRYRYDLWGVPSIDLETVPQPLLYAGYWYDRELHAPNEATGWYWLSVRSYDPALKRFLQPDPSMQEGVRSYVYVDDDPVDWIDPSGLGAKAVAVPAPTPSPGPTPPPGTNGQHGSNPFNWCNIPIFGFFACIFHLNAAQQQAWHQTELRLGLLGVPLAAGGTGPTPPSWKRVGRWMNKEEYVKMINELKVQESVTSDGVTYVVNTLNPRDFPASGPGTVFVEFDVPEGSLYPASKPQWSAIPSPNSALAKRYAKLGRAIPTDLPQVKNVQLTFVKGENLDIVAVADIPGEELDNEIK